MVSDNQRATPSGEEQHRRVPTIVKKWEIIDRGDGASVRTSYRDGRIEKRTWSDDDLRDFAKTILSVIEAPDDERPVSNPIHEPVCHEANPPTAECDVCGDEVGLDVAMSGAGRRPVHPDCFSGDGCHEADLEGDDA